MLQVTQEEMCLVVPLILEVKVGRVQEASVTLYDYYEPRERNTTKDFAVSLAQWWANYGPGSICDLLSFLIWWVVLVLGRF